MERLKTQPLMNFKNILPHLLAISIFFLLVVTVYHPYFFDGKGMSQHDILQAYGANQQLKDYRAETGDEALWMNSMFSGMPAYLNGVQYSGDLLKYVYKIIRLGMPHPMGVTFLSFFGFYILLLAFRVRPWLAIGGAILFGLNGFNIISIGAGHNAKIAAVALMPLVLAGIKLTFSDRKWLGVGLTALALGLQIRANHPQMTYYLLLVTIIYGIYELVIAIRSNELIPFSINIAWLVVAASLAVGANSGKLYHILEYGKYSTRGSSEMKTDESDGGLGYEYAFRFSNGLTEPLVMFYPNIFGGSTSQKLSDDSNSAKALMRQGYSRLQAQQQVQAMPTYWGDQPLTAPYYAGSILLFLLVIGLLTLSKEQKIWLLAIAVLGIVFSWGKNFSAFNTLMFDYLPGYNKFRSVTFTIILPILAFNLIAFIGLENWLQKEKVERFKALKWSFIVAGGFSLLLIIAAGLISYRGAIDAQLPEWLVGALRDDRKMLLRKDAFQALIFTTIIAGILWGYNKEVLSVKTLVLLLTGIVIVDILPLSKRFVNKNNFSENPKESYFTPTPADLWIMQNSSDGERVLNLQNPWNEARTSYFHESIGGYHGAKLHRYQDLVDRYLANQSNEAITKLQAGNRDFSNLQVLNMLNTKFLVAGPQKEAVLTNPYAFGNAWLVNEITSAKTPDEVMDVLGKTNLKEKAVINISEFTNVKYGGSGAIGLTKKTPNRVKYKANISDETGLAVFSEVYYPKGWTATIDGKEVELLRVNYLLRALNIPEGEHEIVFEFKPPSYATTNSIMLICCVIIIVGFAMTAWMDRKTSA
ncbi:MAG: YfhO family protein [Cytophagales bacterium]|nr:YfhO family protein [Cytophagales bacterium]